MKARWICCVLGLLSLATLPLSAQPASYCFTTPTPLPDGSLTTIPFDVTDNFAAVGVELVINLQHTYVGDLLIRLESPAGTVATVMTSTLGADQDNLDVRFFDLGIAFSYDQLTCSCRVQPALDNLSVFAGEPAFGTWQLTIEDQLLFDSGTLNSACLQLFGTATVPVTDLQCVRQGFDQVAFSWTNNEIYFGHEIWAGDVQVASVSGLSESFVLENVPVLEDVEFSFRSTAFDLGYPAVQTCTSESIIEAQYEEVCVSDPFVGTESVLPLEFMESALVGSVELSIELTQPTVGNVTLRLTSPSGTALDLMDGLLVGGLDLTFSTQGLSWSSSNRTCRCFSQPPGGSLNRFTGEPANGTWSLTILDSSGQATLEQACLRIYPTSEPLVESFTCEYRGNNEVELSWVNNDLYLEHQVWVRSIGGWELVATLEGDQTEYRIPDSATTQPIQDAIPIALVSPRPAKVVSSVHCRVEPEFTTFAGSCATSTGDIPTNAPLELPILIERDFSVHSIQLGLVIEHSDIGALDVSLRSPQGETAPLLVSPHQTDSPLDAIFSEGGSVFANAAGCPAQYLATNSLSALTGIDSAGLWTLVVGPGPLGSQGSATCCLWLEGQTCVGSSFAVGSTQPTVQTLEVRSDLLIQSTELRVEVVGFEVSLLQFQLTSPEGTSVGLTTSGGTNGCPAPRIFDDSDLLPFAGENARGVWTLTTSTDASLGNEVLSACLSFPDSQPGSPPIENFACTNGLFGAASLTWENGGDYQRHEIYKNGVLEAVLPGFATEYGTTFPTNDTFRILSFLPDATPSLKECLLNVGSPAFLRGDCFPDGQIDIADLRALIHGDLQLDCLATCDFDGDGDWDLNDVATFVDSYFFGGQLPAPFPDCETGTGLCTSYLCGEIPPAAEPDLELAVEHVEVFRGSDVELAVTLTNNGPVDVSALSFGLCIDPSLTIVDAELGGPLAALNNGQGPASSNIDFELGGLTLAAVLDEAGIDSFPPGVHEVLKITVETELDSGVGERSISICDDMGVWETRMVLTDGTPVVPETAPGIVEILPAAMFIRGDANGDGLVDIGDAMFVLAYLVGTVSSSCPDPLDVNADGVLDLSDFTYLTHYLFQNGPEPFPPFPEPGFSTGFLCLP